MLQHRADQAVHEAARAGLLDKLAEMLTLDPSLIDAKGMDARTPLHCAGTVPVAALLLDHGARIDARDEDHDSTPAQWRIGEAPDVARFLLERGSKPDIFLAAALGDMALAQKLVAEDRGCLGYRIGKSPEFPPLGHQGRGGTIYQWTLRFNSYPHQIALMKGHEAMFDFLYAASDMVIRLLVNCVLARRTEAEAIAEDHPEIVQSLPDVDRELVAKYCWETNTNFDAVKLMLDIVPDRTLNWYERKYRRGRVCEICGDARWVCEDHPDKPWGGASTAEDACNCGAAGMLCLGCNQCSRDQPPRMPPGYRSVWIGKLTSRSAGERRFSIVS